MANLINFGISPGSLAAGLSMDGNSRELEYVMTFDVPVDDTETILLVPQVPFPGYEYPYNDTLKCTGITVQPEQNNHRVWRVKAQYDASGVAIEEGFAYGYRVGSNPINKAAKSAFGKIIPAISSSQYVDDFGKDSAVATIPIETSAEMPFGEPLTYVQHNTVFSWWQIESSSVGDIIESGEYTKYIGTINAEDVSFCEKTFSSGMILMRGMEPEQYYYRNPYSTQSEIRWKVTYTLEYNSESWWDKPLDQGFDAYLP